MTKQLDGYYIFNIPIQWAKIYKYLLTQISNQAIDILKDCNGACNSNSTSLLKCWNIFQIACVAYEKKEYNKANTLLQLLLNDCICLRGKFKYDDYKLITDDDGNFVLDLDYPEFTILCMNNALEACETSFEDLYNETVDDFPSATPQRILDITYDRAITKLIKVDNLAFNDLQFCEEHGATKHYIVDEDDLKFNILTDKQFIFIKYPLQYELVKITYKEGTNLNTVYDNEYEINELMNNPYKMTDYYNALIWFTNKNIKSIDVTIKLKTQYGK